ncbi:MAG: GHMP kinase [Chloroflexi bacterium]|nr:MAG: GHMP kinase [Chloroflexota bacterium]
MPEECAELVPALRTGHTAILEALQAAGLAAPPYPQQLPAGNPEGTAAARAFVMQGVLKYHGLADWDWRTAYLPSISLNNDAAQTLTWVQFDPRLAADEVTIGGVPASGREQERVVRCLQFVREQAHITSRARVLTRNQLNGGTADSSAKGLGTSASGSAALAMAALTAAFGPQLGAHPRLLTCTARLLAGSGCRSAAGGLALWLSYPGIAHADSYAVRLDLPDALRDVRLLTVPLPSRAGLRTEAAHLDAPRSSFFGAWLQSRTAEVLQCLGAAQRGDWQCLGEWAELDSIRLHGVTMSGSRTNKIFAWEPENILLFRMCNALRSAGTPVYCSTDTGPTAVFITSAQHADAVAQAINATLPGAAVVRGGIGGPAQIVDALVARQQLEQ